MKMGEDEHCPLDDKTFVTEGYTRLKELFDLIPEGIAAEQWPSVSKLCYAISGSMWEMFHSCIHLMTEDESLLLQKEILEQRHGRPYIIMSTPFGRMLLPDEFKVPDDIKGLDGE